MHADLRSVRCGLQGCNLPTQTSTSPPFRRDFHLRGTPPSPLSSLIPFNISQFVIGMNSIRLSASMALRGSHLPSPAMRHRLIISQPNPQQLSYLSAPPMLPLSLLLLRSQQVQRTVKALAWSLEAMQLNPREVSLERINAKCYCRVRKERKE